MDKKKLIEYLENREIALACRVAEEEVRYRFTNEMVMGNYTKTANEEHTKAAKDLKLTKSHLQKLRQVLSEVKSNTLVI